MVLFQLLLYFSFCCFSFFFFFNDTATTEIYTLSLHDALPISPDALSERNEALRPAGARQPRVVVLPGAVEGGEAEQGRQHDSGNDAGDEQLADRGRGHEIGRAS